MNRPPRLPAAAGLLLAVLACASPLGAQEKAPPPKPPGQGAQDRPAAANAVKPQAQEPASGRLEPAGMVRVSLPGGKAKVGMNRDELKDLIKRTALGSVANIESLIEDEYSVSCPEHAVDLPSFWIGRYEVTNAQYHRFLESTAKVKYTVPPAGRPGERTLEEIARKFLVCEPFKVKGGVLYYPVANDWRALYDLNADSLNPPAAGQDPRTLPRPESFQSRTLPPGTEILCYRWSVPQTWKVKGRLQAAPPPGWESVPVTAVSLADAMACAEFYGCHIPTEDEWEVACRSGGGELWPEGKAMDPLGHAWKDFNPELLKAKPVADRTIASARRSLEDAKAAGNPVAIATAQARVDRLEWIQKAHELPDPLDPPFVEVGSFPFGANSFGALDMIGNVDEWTSTPLCRYPNSDTKSRWIDYKAYVLRGGNVLDKDSVLTATFRKFKSADVLIGKHFKAASAGFRAARYETPGASAGSHIVGRISESSPPILPREEEKRSHRLIGPGLDVYRASGIERYDEVAWAAAASPKNDPARIDPAGKVFWLGAAESLCVIPATGTPFHEPSAIRNAAENCGLPPAGTAGKPAVDPREPRRMPFLGALHWTDGLSVKGEIRREVRKEVPRSPEEIKAEIERRKKEKEEKEKKDSGDGKDSGGGDKPPEKKMGDKSGDGKGGGNKGGGAAGGGDKGGGDKGGGDAGGDAKEGDKGDEEGDKPDESKEPKVATTKWVTETLYEKGALKGSDRPGGEGAPTISDNGALLGLVKVGEDVRAVLWEARYGSVAKDVAGGSVMLEPPLVVLPKDCLDLKRVNQPVPPDSKFNTTSGEATLTFYIPVEGREKSDWIKVTLKLDLVDYPSPTTERPWVTLSGPVTGK